MTGCVANPATAWTSGQRMICADDSLVTWSGTTWVGGPAPLAARKSK